MQNYMYIYYNLYYFFFSVTDGKSNKRRLLTKKRAMTTSFFDIGKKDLSGGMYNINILEHNDKYS